MMKQPRSWWKKFSQTVYIFCLWSNPISITCRKHITHFTILQFLSHLCAVHFVWNIYFFRSYPSFSFMRYQIRSAWEDVINQKCSEKKKEVKTPFIFTFRWYICSSYYICGAAALTLLKQSYLSKYILHEYKKNFLRDTFKSCFVLCF